MPAGVYPRRPLADRFWAKVNKNGPIPLHRPELGACWVWTAARHPWGYGCFFFNGRLRGAHVVAYVLTTGSEPHADRPFILHHCDGGAIGCVRPSHLYAGTAQNNTDDMIARGRKVTVPLAGDLNPMRRNPERAARGERNAAAKVTGALVLEIRTRYATEAVRQKDLAAEYGLAQSALGSIVTGKSWAHVGGPITHLGKGDPRRRTG